MTSWLLLAVAVLLAVFVALGVNDAWQGRRSLPPVRQSTPRAPEPGPATGPWHPEFLLNRGRRVRWARAYARSRYPADPTAYAPGSPPGADPPTEETPCRSVLESLPTPRPPTSPTSSPPSSVSTLAS